jgi:hypothetical protein
LLDADRVHDSEAIRESARFAPEVFATAERERAEAHRAENAGDRVGATLRAERALGAYDYAVAASRTAKAALDSAEAAKSLDEAKARLASLEASRSKLEDDAAELEKRLATLQMRLKTAASGVAPPERLAARRTAARALVAEARLLCDAARLVAPGVEGLAVAQTAVDAASDIDAAGRARTGCLDVLTRARRGPDHSDVDVDALLTEISATRAFVPSADERGVVVPLRRAYEGSRLTTAAKAALETLGRIAKGHPSFAVQLVLHDARPPTSPMADRELSAAAEAIEAGGATAEGLSKTTLGPQPSIADPQGQGQNGWLDVVFVAK